jgi:hypothetical protein
VLEGAGLITRTRRATARLSHLRAEPLRDATVWLAGYREYWEESYERLDELLSALQHDPHDAPQHEALPDAADRSPNPDPGGDPTGRSMS